MTATAAPEGGRRLAQLRVAVQEAVDFASDWPEEYRPKVFDAALDELRGVPTREPRTTPAGGTAIRSVAIPAEGLEGIAQEIDVDLEALARTIEIDAEGRVSVLGRIDGRATSQLQVRYSLVYCYVRERALGQFSTPIDELRTLCQAHGCYDMKNFTSYFRTASDVIREIGDKGAHDRAYRLAPRGMEAARALLKEMAEA
jgi:hypothetical protein